MAGGKKREQGESAREPPQLRVGRMCPRGHLPFELRDSSGHVERGFLDLNRAVEVRPCPKHGGETEAAGSGPAQVASDAYRAGWDAIFAAPRGKVRPEKPN